MSLVSLVDRDRQWFKARIGIDAPEGPREGAFCDHAIRRHEVFLVEDARLDSRFAGQPMVVSAPHVRFYAGAPLIAPSGDIIGTLAVLDRVPRRLSEGQVSALRLPRRGRRSTCWSRGSPRSRPSSSAPSWRRSSTRFPMPSTSETPAASSGRTPRRRACSASPASRR